MRSQEKSMRIGQQKQHVHFKTCLFRQAARKNAFDTPHSGRASSAAFLLKLAVLVWISSRSDANRFGLLDCRSLCYRIFDPDKAAVYENEGGPASAASRGGDC